MVDEALNVKMSSSRTNVGDRGGSLKSRRDAADKPHCTSLLQAMSRVCQYVSVSGQYTVSWGLGWLTQCGNESYSMILLEAP